MVSIGKLGRWRKVSRKYCVNNQNLFHPCINEITKLKENIKSYLQKLNIFDTGNVLVCYVEIWVNIECNIECKVNVKSYNIYGDPSLVNRNGQKGIYIVVGNSCKLRCDNRSNIIYIGGQEKGRSQSLYERIRNFIAEFEENGSHSGAKKIKERLKELCRQGQTQKTCLYIIGLPLKDEHRNIVEKVEGCFQVAYKHLYLQDPCFVDQTEDPNFNIFLIPPDDARRTIQFILTAIDIFFRDCIQNC